MTSANFDHVALPCFDVRATHRFYGTILGWPLVFAQSGRAETWCDGDYLLLAYRLPDGSCLDFFAYDGISRPAPDGLPKDIRHIAIAVPKRDDVMVVKKQLENAKVALWEEIHEVDDLHVYATDPNGVVIEFVAQEDGSRARASDVAAAKDTLERWLAR